MSARISIDLDDTPDATVEVTTGGRGPGSVWMKLRGEVQPSGEQERYEVWLTPAQALSAHRGLGDVLMALNIATIEAAGLESPARSYPEALAIVRAANWVTIPVTDEPVCVCGLPHLHSTLTS